MRKINDVGLKLLEYKEELMKDYPKIVRDSLLFSLEQMVENDVINIDAYEILKNGSESKENFTEFLLSSEKYTKSYEELFEEYEVIRKELDDELKMHELFELETKTDVESDSINVIKTFRMDDSFIKKYFGVGEEELNKLTKKKGFAEQFTTLRLNKIINDLIEQGQKGLKILTLDKSLTYFGENNANYNIDLIMKVPVDSLLILDDKNRILVEIKEIRMLSERMYKSKTVI